MIHLNEARGVYEGGGKTYARMTSAMKCLPRPWLEKWRVKFDEENGEGAAVAFTELTADVGSLIHDITQWYDWGRMWKEAGGRLQYQACMRHVRRMLAEDPWLSSYIVAWVAWSTQYIKKWLWVERLVFSDDWRVAGRIDRLGIFKYDEQVSLVDVKSTKVLHKEMGVQLYGYRKMIEEEVRREGKSEWWIPERTVIAHLPGPRPGEEPRLDRVRVKEYDWTMFEAPFEECVEQYWAMNR